MRRNHLEVQTGKKTRGENNPVYGITFSEVRRNEDRCNLKEENAPKNIV